MLTCVLMAAGPAAGVSPVIIDYPPENALFPSDVFAPTFLWRDPESSAAVWRIEVTFAGRSARKQNLSVVSQGEKPPLGAIDENCTKAEVVTPEPEPGQAGQHSWRPPDDVWKKIKRYSTGAAATLTITGFLDPALGQPVSRAGLHIRTSSDPVGAPVFFRDIPLIFVPLGEKGVIMPLPADAIPLIAWRLRWVNEPRSRLMTRQKAFGAAA